MLVKGAKAGVDRVGVDGDLDLAGLGGAVKFNRAFFLVKAAAVGRGAKVADLEGHVGVCRVDGVVGGLGLGAQREQRQGSGGNKGSNAWKTPDKVKVGLRKRKLIQSRQLGDAAQSQLELDLHVVGHHRGVGPVAFADLERQPLDRQHAGCRGDGAAL